MLQKKPKATKTRQFCILYLTSLHRFIEGIEEGRTYPIYSLFIYF